jgi:SAM-dependent methyltransferase
MVDLDFAATALPIGELNAVAARLEDRVFAELVVEKGMQQLLTDGSVWLPRMVLVAAQRLGRVGDFFQLYEHFLTWTDSVAKIDWQAAFSDRAPAGDIPAQSGRLGAKATDLEKEFRRIFEALEPRQGVPILDIGCGGGLWAIQLAKMGFNVLGTDHHAGIIEAARQNAKIHGVEDKLEFRVDDVCNSKLAPADYSPRVMCISVTNGLPDDNAFDLLVQHLDQVSRPERPDAVGRRIVLGHNRWAPTRMDAVRGILANEPENYVRAVSALFLVECTWWMHPRHIESMKQRFSSVTHVGEVVGKLDGTRIDLLLQ